MTFVKQNISALKAADNMKWDFKATHQRALAIFDLTGEATEEYKNVVKELGGSLKSFQENLELLNKEYESLYSVLFP